MQHRQVTGGDKLPPELFDNSEQLMTYEQLAELLNVSKRTLMRWRLGSKVPFVQVGRTIRFSREQIREWLHKRGA